MKSLAKVLSFVLNPFSIFLVMPFLVVYKQTGSFLYAAKWGAFSALFVFMSLFILIVGMARGVFSDVDVVNKEERKTLYFFLLPLTFLYLFSSLFLKGLYFPLSIIAFGIVLGAVLFTIANRFAKVSMHAGVVSSFAITVGILYQGSSLLLLLLIPLIAWSRLTLKKHTVHEVIIGGLLGSLVTFVTFIIGLYLYQP